MNSPRQAFLDALSSGLQPYLMRFADRLMESDSEIFVAMARKAVCLLDAMNDVGLLGLSGVVTSDRVLDMNLDWIQGKKVSLVDDILVSGTTLRLTRERLVAVGANVRTTVLSTNSMYWQPSLITPDDPHMSLDDRSSLVLCTEIVNAISLVPRPYNVDWPLIDGLRIPRNREYVLGALPGWDIFDTTSTMQRQVGVRSTTHDATPSVLQELDRRLGVELLGTGMAKVRVYSREGGPRRSTRTRVVPIVSLDGLPHGTINSIFETLLGPIPDIGEHFDSAGSRLRLIQFVAAARLGQIWIDHIRQTCGASAPDRLDDQQIGYAFPPPVVETVIALCEGRRPIAEESPKIVSGLRRSVPLEVASREPVLDHWNLQELLTTPFLELFHEKELPARRLLKSQGAPALKAPELRSLLGRLDKGYSFAELVESIRPVCRSIDAARVLSIFLDSAIDHGVTVPITIDDGTSVFRAFRHGEDVEFSEVEARLFALMLGAYRTKANLTEMPRLVVEKLCVLLLKIGVAKGILNRWGGRLGEGGSVGVRYALKGARVEQRSSSLFAYSPEQGLPEMLEAKGMLVQSKSGMYRLGKINNTAPTSTPAESEAIKLGTLFGALLSDKTNGISPGELTLLATCLREYELVPALAAEIAVVERTVDRFVGLAGSAEARLNPEKCEADLRRTTYWEAIHSGQWKFSWQRSGKIRDIVDRVEAGFDDAIYAQEWRQYWSSNFDRDLRNPESSRGATPDLRSLSNDEGRWLIAHCIYSHVVCIALLYRSGASASSPRVKKSVDRVLHDAEMLRQYVSRSRSPEPAVFAESVASRLAAELFDPDETLVQATQGIRHLMSFSTPLLDRARAICNPFGQPRSMVSFHSCLVVSINESPISTEVRRELEDIIRTQAGLAAKRGVRFDSVPEQQTYLSDAFVVAAAGEEANRRLGMLAAELLDPLRGEHAVRILGFAEMPPHARLFLGDGSGTYNGDSFWAHLRERTSSVNSSLTPLSTFVSDATASSRGMVAAFSDRLERKGILAEREKPTVHHDSIGSEAVTFSVGPPMSKVAEAGVGIITIVTEESQAVLDWMSRREDFVRHVELATNRGFASCTFEVEDLKIRVVQTQTVNQGTQAVINAYHAMRSYCRPRVVVLLGIGGGIHADVKLGDVVLANQIVYYDRRAETASGIRHRGESSQVPSLILQSLNRFLVDLDDGSMTANSGNDVGGDSDSGHRFSVRMGPLGCGEAVLKFKESETRRWLHEVNEKTLVVETEAHGVATAFFEDPETRGYIVIRGISDHADEKKDDSWRATACRNAVAALDGLLRHLVPVVRG